MMDLLLHLPTSFRLQHLSLPWLAALLIGCSGGGQPVAVDPVAQPPEPHWEIDAEEDEARVAQASELSVTLPEVAVVEEQHFAEPKETEKIYRPDDTHPQPDLDRLRSLGIEQYESKHFRLYTDIDPVVARTLPPLIDQLYAHLVDYFGELPPSRTGADYQITGYIISERDRFQAADLLPDDLPLFEHGRHRGQAFWMNDQEYDYYRRHLAFHEATHCFMMTMPGIHPPLWYLEGMAEFFATHRLDPEGNVTFGVMPDRSEDFVGFGRIQMIQAEVNANRLLNIDQVNALGTQAFSVSRTTPYAWSWALCRFLDSHPRYQERFRQLSNYLVGRKFFELANDLFAPDKPLLNAEWDQFVRTIEYGWEIPANAFVLENDEPQLLEDATEISVQASHFWQSTGFIVEADTTYVVTATGEVTLADEPRPWLSEPQGITIRYANDHPIGTLMVATLPLPSLALESEIPPIESFIIGREGTFTPAFTGLLMVNVNDFGSERSDNRGAYQVRCRPEN